MDFFRDLVAITEVYRESLGLPKIPRYKVVSSCERSWYVWDNVTREHVRAAESKEQAQRIASQLNEAQYCAEVR